MKIFTSLIIISMSMILAGSLLIIGGCAGSASSQSPTDFVDKKIECESFRPQVCIQNYNPVCGELINGSHLTYSNSCQACSDHNVSGYRPGPCEQKGLNPVD